MDTGVLGLGGLDASRTSRRQYGTPLVVLCEDTIRARARLLRAAVGERMRFFGAKAFPNVALLRLLREEDDRSGRRRRGRAGVCARCRPDG